MISRPKSIGDAWRVMIQQKDKITELENYQKQSFNDLTEYSKIIDDLEGKEKALIDVCGASEDKIAELEKELSSVVAGLFSEHDLAIRDLEQQAKALYYFEVNEDIGSVACDQIKQSLEDRSYELWNQAKALKDQG